MTPILAKGGVKKLSSFRTLPERAISAVPTMPYAISISLLLLFLIHLSYAVSASNYSAGADGFTANFFSAFFNANFSSIAHSAAFLSNGDVIIAGTITYPAGVTQHPGIVNDVHLDITDSTQKKRTSLILRLSMANHTVIWAHRAVPCSAQTRFALNIDETRDAVFMSGATTGFVNSSDPTMYPGAVITHYSLNGTREAIRIHGSEKHAYHFLTTTSSLSSKLLILGYCPFNSTNTNKIAALAPQGGLCAIVLQKSDLSIEASFDLTNGPIGVANATLRRDDWWHGATSHDRSTVYVTIRRHVIINEFLPSSRAMILAFRSDNLQQIGSPALLPTGHVPQHVRLAVASNGVVFAAYIDRGGNKEAITVRRYDRALMENYWTSSETVDFVREIERELVIGRPVPSIVNAAIAFSKNVDTNQDGIEESVAVLLYTAELVDRNTENASDLLMMTNPRVAVVAVDPSANVRWISQSQQLHWWEPLGVALYPRDQNTLLVIGADLGTTESTLFRTGGHMLATEVYIKSDDEDKRSPQTGNDKDTDLDTNIFPTPSPTRSGSTLQTSELCIGMSSHVKGWTILEIVRLDKRFRLQRHPIQMGIWGAKRLKELFSGRGQQGKTFKLVKMSCLQWNNDGARLCATDLHVIRVNGKLMYMEELCKNIKAWKAFGGVKCESGLDVPFNFKSICSEGVEVYPGIHVTMHSGQIGKSAETVVAEECELQQKRILLWRLKTM